MPGFFDLPVELRLSILEYVLYAEREPSLEYHENDRASRREMMKNKAMNGWFFGKGVHCETDPHAYRPNVSAILAVNHQMRNDAKSVADSIPLVYKLDLAIMQGRLLWPTWTCLPTARSTVDEIQVKIHTTGPGMPCGSILRGGCGGPPLWYWWFYTMLEHFFIIGVVPQKEEILGVREVEESYNLRATRFATSSGTPFVHRQRMATRVLDMDFIDPLTPWQNEPESNQTTNQESPLRPNVNPEDFQKCPHCFYNCQGHLLRRQGLYRNWNPFTVYSHLSGIFLSLLSPDLADWGTILHRGVETIRFRVNGEIQQEQDVAEYLRDNWPDRHRHVPNMAWWRQETAAVRATFGLKNL